MSFNPTIHSVEQEAQKAMENEETKTGVDFRATNNAGGEVVWNSVNMEGYTSVENDQQGSFVEAIAQQGKDDNLDQDSSGREIVPGDEPYVGQEFDSEAAAYTFYEAYAKRVGFTIRASRLSRLKDHRSETGRMLVCTREGIRLCDKHESALENKEERKAGCKAKLVMKKMISGKWVVQKFIKEHNHPVAPVKGQRDLIYDQYSDQHEKIRELTQSLAFEKRRAAAYKRHLTMVIGYIEEYNERTSKTMNKATENVGRIEVTEQENH